MRLFVDHRALRQRLLELRRGDREAEVEALHFAAAVLLEEIELAQDFGQDVGSGRIVIQSRPEVGVWRVRIAGAGIFSAVVQARSPISFHGAEFVELGGRPGHEGYFPLKTPAHLNVPQVLSARLSAPVGAAVFYIVNAAGETLQQLDLASSSENGDDREFMGSVTFAHATFRVVVEGRDASGFGYQRLYPRLFELKP